jgi:hypothetical protein
MLTRFLAAVGPKQPAAALLPEGQRVARPGIAGDDPAGLRAEDPAKRMRALAESCSDGLAALAYAQFADLLEPRSLPPYRGSEPAARSR